MQREPVCRGIFANLKINILVSSERGKTQEIGMSFLHNSNPNQLLQSNQMTPPYYYTASKTKPLDSANAIFFGDFKFGNCTCILYPLDLNLRFHILRLGTQIP